LFRYEDYFKKAGEATLLKKLYKYRSQLVHGETVSFSGELQALKSDRVRVSALAEMCKILILASLAEPELAEDLKRC
jgi:hypothetical protein